MVREVERRRQRERWVVTVRMSVIECGRRKLLDCGCGCDDGSCDWVRSIVEMWRGLRRGRGRVFEGGIRKEFEEITSVRRRNRNFWDSNMAIAVVGT